MKDWFKKTLLSTAMVTIGTTSIIPSVYALDDVMNTPSVQSAIAQKRLLLDIVGKGQRMVAVGERGHILYSDDAGKNWNQASVPVSVTLTAVYFPSETVGWAVGHGGIILKTTDSGKSWQKVFDGNQANNMMIAQADKRVKNLESKLESAAGDTSEIEYQLEEAQFAQDDAKSDASIGPSKPLLDVWFKNEQEGFVIGAYGFFFKTSDGGATWENYATRVDNQDRFHLNAISQVVGGALFIVGEAGNIFRSTDLGESWERMESPYDGSLFGLTGTGNVNEVIVFGLRGNVYRSEDLGETWDHIDAGTESTFMAGASDSDGNVVLVGNSGTFSLSANAGKTFKSKAREDRLGLVSVLKLKNQNMVFVGEGGARVVGADGHNL